MRLRAENLAEEARAAAAEPMPCVAVHVTRHPDERGLPHLARPYLVGSASLSMAQLEQVRGAAGCLNMSVDTLRMLHSRCARLLARRSLNVVQDLLSCRKVVALSPHGKSARAILKPEAG